MMAIFMAFQAPEIEVIGLTTVFGNVDTELATVNALHLVGIFFRDSMLIFTFFSSNYSCEGVSDEFTTCNVSPFIS